MANIFDNSVEGPMATLLLRYNGYWRLIPSTSKNKYEGGKQKTLRVEIEKTTLKTFGEYIAIFLQWVKGHLIKLTYEHPEKFPKEYINVRTNQDFKVILELGRNCQVKVYMSSRYNATRSARTRAPEIMVCSNGDDQDNEQSDDISAGYNEQDVFSETENDVDQYEIVHNTHTNEPSNDEANLASHDNPPPATEVEQEDCLSDEADNVYEEEEYHSLHSSSTEYDPEEDDEVQYNEEPIYDVNWENPVMKFGKKFTNVDSFRFALQQHSVLANFNYFFVKNESKRVVAHCQSEDCPWMIRGTRLSDNVSFEITFISDKHTCFGINRQGNQHATTKWLANNIIRDVKENPAIKPREIAHIIDSRFVLKLNYQRCWRGKEKATELLFGKVDDSFDYIPALKCELMKSNPGSHVNYELDSCNRFMRMFVCLKATIDGFKLGCRPFIGLDACHLKSKYLGVLLSATALDANNGLFPVAYGVAETESFETWHWFLLNLQQAFGVDYDMNGVVFMSDQDKGILNAVTAISPAAEHRVCMRHFYKNFKKKYPGDFFEACVWSASRAYSKSEFNVAMNDLKEKSVPAYNDLMSIVAYAWSRHHYRVHCKNSYMTNNLAESFNAWILKERGMPHVYLVDSIRIKLMQRMQHRRKLAYRWKGILVPMAVNYLRNICTMLGGWLVHKSTDHIAEVESTNERMVIDLKEMTCTCRRWQLTGLPCIHAAEVIASMRGARWEDYVADFFTIARYKKTYIQAIAALPSKEQWEEDNERTFEGKVKPSNSKRPRGRPKNNRIRGEDEYGRPGRKKPKRSNQCGRCKGYGHNKSSCKEPLNSSQDPLAPSEDQENGYLGESEEQMRGRGRSRGRTCRGRSGSSRGGSGSSRGRGRVSESRRGRGRGRGRGILFNDIGREDNDSVNIRELPLRRRKMNKVKAGVHMRPPANVHVDVGGPSNAVNLNPVNISNAVHSREAPLNPVSSMKNMSNAAYEEPDQ